MDAHKLDVKIQGHSYMHMITVKGHLGNVSLHLNQMINPYEWFVELIFFWSLGGQQIESFVQNLELWLIVSNSNAFVYLIVDHSVWKVLIKNAIDLDHRLYICRVSRIYCQFLRFFFMGGVVVSNQSTEITALLMCLYAYSVAKTGNLAIFLRLFKILVSMI